MQAYVDARLLSRSPSWYRTPRAQSAALGVVFFWVFAAYTTIQFYSASTYGAELAADAVSAVYAAFTMTCLFSPGVVNKWGCRRSMLCGILGYGALVLSSMIYFLYGGGGGGGGDDGVDGDVNGGGRVVWTRRLVVAGGAVLGCGASTLWTAQGRLILQYASRAEALLGSADVAASTSTSTPTSTSNGGEKSRKNKSQTGELMGLFWAIFQCSSLVGGSVSFFYYGRDGPRGSTALYALFLAFIFAGAMSTQLLLPPEMLQREEQRFTERSASNTNGADSLDDDEEADIELMNADEQSPLAPSGTDPNEGKIHDSAGVVVMGEDLSHQTWTQEALGTLRLFFTRKMMCLSPLFFYTGFNQPYQQATFGNRFFTRRTIGAELIVFHLMEIVGAIVVGRFLDRERGAASTRRTRAIVCLGSFVVINCAGNIFAAAQEYAAKRNGGTPIAHDIAGLSVVSPSLAFACWGFADAQIQVFCYWLMGGFYTLGSDHSRAVGFYKMVQSLGTSVGFYFIPTSRLSEISQLACSSLFFVLGTALSFSQLPSRQYIRSYN